MALADLIIIMNNGRIEQAGAPRDIFNAPASEFVARFIGGHNIIAEDGRKISVRSDRLQRRRAAATACRLVGRATSNIRAPPCSSALATEARQRDDGDRARAHLLTTGPSKPARRCMSTGTPPDIHELAA